MTMAHACADSFIDGPVGIDEIFDMGKPFVDDFRTRGSGISVHAVDACADAAHGKGDISLQYICFSRIIQAHFSEIVHRYGSFFRPDPGEIKFLKVILLYQKPKYVVNIEN